MTWAQSFHCLPLQWLSMTIQHRRSEEQLSWKHRSICGSLHSKWLNTGLFSKITNARSCISRRDKIRKTNPVVPTAELKTYQTIGYSIVLVSPTGHSNPKKKRHISLSNPTKKYDWITIVFPRSLYINPELRSNRFNRLIYIY